MTPWHKPWRSVGSPRNLVSNKLYRGVNVWLLTAQSYTSPSPYWATSLAAVSARARQRPWSSGEFMWMASR